MWNTHNRGTYLPADTAGNVLNDNTVISSGGRTVPTRNSRNEKQEGGPFLIRYRQQSSLYVDWHFFTQAQALSCQRGGEPGLPTWQAKLGICRKPEKENGTTINMGPTKLNLHAIVPIGLRRPFLPLEF